MDSKWLFFLRFLLAVFFNSSVARQANKILNSKQKCLAGGDKYDKICIWKTLFLKILIIIPLKIKFLNY